VRVSQLYLFRNNERDAENEPPAIQLVDPFAYTQGRLTMLGVIDQLVNLMRLARGQHVLVVLNKRLGVCFPDQLVVLLSRYVFASQVAYCGIRRKADRIPTEGGQQTDDCGHLLIAG
jgi:hypothetical protein